MSTFHIIDMLSAQRVFRYCVYIWVSTILICYTIAVSLGHVPLWLPMISDCAITAPEKYIFRLGFISGANYMFISSLLYFIYFKSHVERDKQENKSSAMFVPPIVSLILAFVASLAVAVVGAVNEREDMNVHEGAALTFFAMLLLYMALTTIQMETTGLLTPTAFRLRVAINILSSLTFIAFMISAQDWKTNYTTIAALEWSFCMYIMAFEWLDSLTVSEKLSAAAIERVDAEPTSAPTEVSPLKHAMTRILTYGSICDGKGFDHGSGSVLYTLL